MKVDVVMPQLGESIVEGTILKWHKKVGERVEKNEILYEVSTDKVDSEVEAPASGILTEILVEEGKTVPVGTKLAVIETEVAAAEEQEESRPSAPLPEETTEKLERPATGEPRPPLKKGPKGRFYSPVVRAIAKQEGVSEEELERIPGTGSGGRVTKRDVLTYLASRKAEQKVLPEAPAAEVQPAEPVQPESEAASTAPTEAAGDVEVVPMSRMRKLIAEHMVLSKRTAPHVTSVAEADVTNLVRFRESMKDEFLRRVGVRLTYTSFFVEAAAKALREFPYMNASVDGDKILLKKRINIGVAVAVDEGLIVPVIKNADELNLVGIAKALHDLSDRARSKKLLPDEIQGGTFSITNIGTFGNLFGTPVIPQPQVGILATGAIKKRVVVVDDAIAIRDMMYLALTYDHRIIDGLYAGRFLQRIVQLLENYSPTMQF